MNRRAFLRFLGLAPAAAALPTRPSWRMVEWFEKPFADGSRGFCATFLNAVTGDRARQAVRAYSSHETGAREAARSLLKRWGADLNTNRAFAADAVRSYGGVLEGYERFVIGAPPTP